MTCPGIGERDVQIRVLHTSAFGHPSEEGTTVGAVDCRVNKLNI